MKKRQFNKMGLLVCIAVLAVSVQARAAGLADASGTLGEVAAILAQASTALAAAANEGNVEDVAEAAKRYKGAKAALGEAQDAYAALEDAIAAGDKNVAGLAILDMDAALKKASDELSGNVAEKAPPSAHEQWKEGQKNTGGGPGRAFDPPNIYDVPWKSEGLRSFYQKLFGNFKDASGFGHGHGFGDRDATPE